MAAYTFDLKVVNPYKTIYAGEVKSLFVKGDKGEFEILPYHHPILSVLVACRIIIDWNKYLPIKGGILKYAENKCTIITD